MSVSGTVLCAVWLASPSYLMYFFAAGVGDGRGGVANIDSFVNHPSRVPITCTLHTE